MRFIKLSFPILILALMLTCRARAEEGAKPSTVPESEIEFNKKSARLTSLATRISEDDKHFQEMVKKKAEEKNDPKELQFTLKDMADIAKDRNKAVDEYNKLKIELTYKFPNKGIPLNRIYSTQSKMTVEEMEGSAGLDELLTRVHKLIQEKYAPFMPADQTSVERKTGIQTRDQKKPDPPLRLER